jgi:hypothetical protein
MTKRNKTHKNKKGCGCGNLLDIIKGGCSNCNMKGGCGCGNPAIKGGCGWLRAHGDCCERSDCDGKSAL